MACRGQWFLESHGARNSKCGKRIKWKTNRCWYENENISKLKLELSQRPSPKEVWAEPSQIQLTLIQRPFWPRC
ncbi:unnamed protein product [Blepharisma stoltei]|uniref:Uncharacterized protein n=1 Tax=Blepharisma stoltei TaxID=1481888 RepID=A0AAU9JIL2_9CILI|nr:unnamed protein product [Blepharisma stoltei]